MCLIKILHGNAFWRLVVWKYHLLLIKVALEGEISKESVQASMSRGVAAAGDLIPWTLTQQVGAWVANIIELKQREIYDGENVYMIVITGFSKSMSNYVCLCLCLCDLLSFCVFFLNSPPPPSYPFNLSCAFHMLSISFSTMTSLSYLVPVLFALLRILVG